MQALYLGLQSHKLLVLRMAYLLAFSHISKTSKQSQHPALGDVHYIHKPKMRYETVDRCRLCFYVVLFVLRMARQGDGCGCLGRPRPARWRPTTIWCSYKHRLLPALSRQTDLFIHRDVPSSTPLVDNIIEEDPVLLLRTTVFKTPHFQNSVHENPQNIQIQQ